MTALTFRKPARKAARLERRWARVSQRIPFPARLADQIAGRIRRLYERVGDNANATTWLWLGTDP